MNTSDSQSESTNQASMKRRRVGRRGPGPLGPGAKRFNVWIPKPMFERIARIADRNNVDVAVAIRDMIRRALKAEPPPEKM